MSCWSVWSAPEFRPKMHGNARCRRTVEFIPVRICVFSDGDWNSVFGSGAPMRQCLSDAALFQLTIGRKGHRNCRTGGLP
jgi:hypothetical protein